MRFESYNWNCDIISIKNAKLTEKTVSSLLVRCKWTLTCSRKNRQMIARNQFFKEVIYACNDLTRFKVMFLNHQTKNNFETLQVWLIILYREWCKIAVVELAKKKLGGGLRYISGINHFPLLAPLVVHRLRLNFESTTTSSSFILRWSSCIVLHFVTFLVEIWMQTMIIQEFQMELGVLKRSGMTYFSFLRLTKSAICRLIACTSVYISDMQAW